jgi:hypothetical protein
MRVYDSVILNEDLPKHSIRAGTVGVIVDDFKSDEGIFLVECFDKDGNTIETVSARADQLTVTLADFHDGEAVALLHDFPAQRLLRGQVGTIKRRTGVGVYEVEFAIDGRTQVKIPLHAGQIMLLHWQRAELVP